MRRLRGLKRLVHDAIDHTTDLVEETHEAVAAKTMRYIDLAGPVALPARAVDQVRRLTAAGVFAAIRGVNHVVDQLTEEGLDVVERVRGTQPGAGQEGEAPTPMRSDNAGSVEWLGDAALGALNGVFGDHLHAHGNELDLGMSLRHQDRYLPLDRAALELALTEATGKVVVFVHGLCCTEWSWCIKAGELHGDPATSFGTLLHRDLGFTSLYIRYNTGRHVSENGRLLDGLLEELVARAYPADVSQLVLIGHSMGGLVIRSACQIAREEGRHWLSPLSHVICLGSPHRGAPFEKLGNVVTSVLGAFDTPGTKIPARVFNTRSAGIKDLRFGYLSDDDWAERDPDDLLADHHRDVPLLDGVAYGFISATVTDDPAHPLGQLVGDILVRVPSATGPVASADRFRISRYHHGGLHHFDLQNHPDVYARILGLVAGAPASARPAP